jgi:hypothetical protein
MQHDSGTDDCGGRDPFVKRMMQTKRHVRQEQPEGNLLPIIEWSGRAY